MLECASYTLSHVRSPLPSLSSYGLPVNFVAVVFHVTKGSARRLLEVRGREGRDEDYSGRD